MFTTITYAADARSQFSTIDRIIMRPRFQATLREARLTQNQLHAAPAPTVRSKGIEVPGSNADDLEAKIALDRATKRVGEIESLLYSIDTLETDLTMLGLPPIAVLPVPLWRHLTRTANVCRFEHFDSDGTVPAQPLGTLANLKLRLDAMPTLELVAKLWPQHHDDIDPGIRVTPYFPQAPERFQQNLLRLGATKYPVYIAAVPEAITVSRKEVLDAHVRANLVAPPALAPTPDQDPVLYTVSADGQLVALLDYFGHFPEEEKLIQRAQAWAERMQGQRER